MMKNIRRTIGVLFIIFMLILSLAGSVFAAQAEGRTVRVACGMNDILYLNKSGAPEGIGLSYLRQLAWNNHWKLEYVEGSYNECLDRLYKGEIDLMFPVGGDEDPEGKLAFSAFNAGYQQIGLFAKKDTDIYYDDFKGFNHKRVGISLGSNSAILDRFAQKNNFSYEKVSINSKQDKIDELLNGSVDLIAFSTLNTVPGGKLVAVLEQIPFYFCTSVANTEILNEINRSMSEIMTHTPEFASELYKEVLVGRNPISYTREEQKKIAGNKKIVFGVYGDRLPLAGIDENGKCVGIYVDLLKAMGNESGLKIEAKPIKNSNELYSYMDNGTVDFVMGIQELRFSQANADKHLSSEHITECTAIAITKPDFDLEKAKAPKIALTKDRVFLEKNINEWFPSAIITYYDNRRQCLDAVNDNKADATFLNTWEFNYESKNARYKSMRQWQSYRINSGVTLGVSRSSDMELLSIFEKTIGKIPATRISDIITSNLNMPYQTYTLGDRLYAVRIPALIVGLFLAVIFTALTIYLRAKRSYIHELEQANKAKTDFLSRMSHELRTPLNALGGYSELIKNNINSKEMDAGFLLENVGSIERAKSYLLRVIDDILDMQNISLGKIHIQKEATEGTAFVDAVKNEVADEAKEKGVILEYSTNIEKNDILLTDGVRVQQILINLLHNAIKFTPTGGKVTFVFDLVDRIEDTATLHAEVKDTGIGMSPEFVKEKLFTIFAQENTGTTSPYEGCGIGLAICKRLLDKMGGTISCESEKDKGADFKVILPVGLAKKVEQKRRPKIDYSNYDLTGTRILLVEDNPMNQDIERRLLEKLHADVELADDGVIALDKFKKSDEGYYNVVLMDIRMPNMDGWECTEKIRELNRSDAKTVPIFAVSANALDEDKQHSLSVGMNEHLTKPVNVVILAETIKNYTKK